MPKPQIKPNTPRKVLKKAVMKIVPGLSSANVTAEIGDKMGAQTIYRELMNSGSTIDKRVYLPQHIMEIFANTKKILMDRGIIMPMKEGHIEQQNEMLPGFVHAIELVQDGDKLAIWGKVFLHEPYFSAFKRGQLPNVSVEIDAEGSHVNGGAVGPYMSAVAMLGRTQPAFPELKVFQKKLGSVLGSAVHGALTQFSKLFKSQKLQSEGNMEFDKELLEGAIGSIESGLMQLKEALAGYEGEEPPAEGEEGEMAKKKKYEEEKAALAKENAELKAKLAAKGATDEVDKEFAKLVAENKATPADKERFVKLVTTNDMEFAKSNFVVTLPSPPAGKDLPSVKHVKLTAEQEAERVILQKMRINEDEIDRLQGVKKGVA